MFAKLAILIAPAALFAAELMPWTPHGNYRSHAVSSGAGQTGFSSLPAGDTGVAFTNHLSQRLVAINRVTENGSGVALGDVDGDGRCDVYLCGLERDNVLYRNLGNWKFEDITAQAGVACAKQLSTGAVFADVDGDGDLDLLVNSIGGGTRLFLNDGSGKFSELTGSRLVRRFSSTSLALGDIDLDGDLDLYVANYRTMVFKDELPQPKIEARLENGRIVVTPAGRFQALRAPGGNAEIFESAERDFCYINDGKGFFSPASWTNGNFLDEAGQKLPSAPLDWGLSVMIRDLNGDFLPDIVVCNDFFLSPDRVWLQQPGFKFQAISFEALRKVSLASMAVDVADINRDGHDDLFFAEMLSRDLAFRQTHRDNSMKANLNSLADTAPFRPEAPRNTLFLNRGDGTYAEIAELAGVDASEWSWGAVFLDVDLDGWEDLLVPTGHNHDVQEADVLASLAQLRVADSIPQRIENLRRFPRLHTPIIAFRNGRDLRFTEAHQSWGLNIPGVVNGFACADLDNDGDLDLVANRLNGAALLLRNNSPAPRIAVRLKGIGPNTQGIGAKLIVRGGPVEQRQTIVSGGRYLSGDDPIRAFAAGSGPMSVEVQWPNRSVSVFTNLMANRVYEFSPGHTRTISPTPADQPPLFADASAALKHRHLSAPVDDYARQPLLPYSPASHGPALAWADLDGDGREDLIIGASRGGKAKIFANRAAAFFESTNILAGRAFAEAQTGLLASRVSEHGVSLIAAISNYEAGGDYAPAAEVRTGTNVLALPGSYSTPGALALSDIDGDGNLDLFLAGRMIPGRYPAAASSRLFRNEGGRFAPDAENAAAFGKLGLVTGAVFADLDGDGRDELITAAEWGEIRIWKNEQGRFSRKEVGISSLRGLWTGLTVGDFDADGRLDFIAGNWGRNHKYQRFLEMPVRLYYGDFDGSGTHDLIEAVYDPARNDYFPLTPLDLLRRAAPALVERFGTFQEFSRTTADALLKGRPGVQALEANTFDSMCFLNRGSTFEARALPVEAQFAPVFGCAAADFDGDGREDIVMAQNIFDLPWETGRLDGGQPLMLKGDGRGSFQALSPVRSGLRADGQQRAVAVADFNRDGRPDLAISQHGGETKLFENRQGAPGLRIRFAGGALNADAIGVRYRIGNGPARQVRAGSGWLSQDSVTQTAPRPGNSDRLAVTWPGGKQSVFAIPANAGEILVTPEGVSTVQTFQ